MPLELEKVFSIPDQPYHHTLQSAILYIKEKQSGHVRLTKKVTVSNGNWERSFTVDGFSNWKDATQHSGLLKTQ